MKNVALSIVTFNRSAFLMEMLESVVKQTVLPDEVFVVDNNSSDNTKELVLEFAEKNKDTLKITYHNTGANLGGAGGFSIGSKLAYEVGYEWIWFADDDIEFKNDCLEQLLKYKNNVQILQPMRINLDGSCAELSGLEYRINNPFLLNPKTKTVKSIFKKQWDIVEIKALPFEGSLFHRSVFEKIGFPDPRFFIFFDDLEFALRAIKNGFKIICVKHAVAIKKIPYVRSFAFSSWKGYFMYRNFFKVQLMYAKKPVGFIRSFIVFCGVLCFSILKFEFKTIPVLFSAFKDAFKKDFPLNKKYLP